MFKVILWDVDATLLNFDKAEEAGIRDQVKIMVGGAVLTEEYAAAIGADAYCKDAMASVNFAIQCE